MDWKFYHAKRKINIQEDYRMFSGRLETNGHLIVPAYVVENLSNILDMPNVEKRLELVVEIKGMMVPPNEWIRVEDDSVHKGE